MWGQKIQKEPFEAVGNSSISSGGSYKYVYQGTTSGHPGPRCNETGTSTMTCDQDSEDAECSTSENYNITDSDPTTCYDNYVFSFLGIWERERSRVFEKEYVTEEGDLTVEGDLNLLGDLLQDGESFDMGEVADGFKFITRIGGATETKVYCGENERAIHGGCPEGEGNLIDNGYECDSSGHPHALCINFEPVEEDGSGVFWLVGENHVNTDCENAGGTVQMDGSGNYFCLFDVTNGDCEAAGGIWDETSGGTEFCNFGTRWVRDIDELCPSGWNQHSNWSSTLSMKCWGTSSTGSTCSRCTTASHFQSSTPVETCGYDQGWFCSSDKTCHASVYEMGCY